MRWFRLLVVVVLLTASAYYHRHNESTPAAGADGSRFVTPLGVIPMKNKARLTPDLHNGYVCEPSRDPRFRAKFTISLSADLTEDFLYELAPVLLPEQAYAILSSTRADRAPNAATETWLTPFGRRDQLLMGLRPYMFRLVNDGNVGFGLAWHDRTRHEEIYVNQKKIITLLTSKVDEVKAFLDEFDVEPFVKPEFITDYETANGDLRSFAEVYPKEYSPYRSDEFMTAVYLPRLVRELGFRRN